MALLNNYESLIQSINDDKINSSLNEAMYREMLQESAKFYEPVFLKPTHYHAHESSPFIDNISLRSDYYPELGPNRNENEEYLLITNVTNSSVKYYIEAISLLKFENYIKIENIAYNIYGHEIPNMKAILCRRDAHDLVRNSTFSELYYSLSSLDKENK